jgi:hypothetical protein
MAVSPSHQTITLSAGRHRGAGGGAWLIEPASMLTFRVRATDSAGNADPTPAHQAWTVTANTPPTASFTFTAKSGRSLGLTHHPRGCCFVA